MQVCQETAEHPKEKAREGIWKPSDDEIVGITRHVSPKSRLLRGGGGHGNHRNFQLEVIK